MLLFLVGLGIILAGGLAALLLGRTPRSASILGAGSAVIGCIFCAIPTARGLVGIENFRVNLPWELPGASLSFGLDAMSAVFLIPILVLGALAAIYGAGYLRHAEPGRSIRGSWFCYNLLLVSMIGVVVATNSVLFLISWETMALSSFFLVMFESDKPEARDAAWMYLSATHLGTAFLLVMFILMASQAGSFDFGAAGCLSGMPGAVAGLIFIFALIGFGTKAGLVPGHVWLPDAHPAAPSHVSALMSGAMIKTGIYGLIRILTFFDSPPLWWAWILLAVGVASGLLGILYACAQLDIKRMLAYSSVENVGIVFLGLGIGMVGRSLNIPVLAVLGFAGALLHVINHSLFKGLLFMGAGSVLHSTGTKAIDRLGGLLKRMKWTGSTFLLGSAAISGLPPFNGFVGEFLIFLGAFTSVAAHRSDASVLPALLVIGALGLIGGLALLGFTRVFGIAFLGEPRSPAAEHAHESGGLMIVPMVLLAAACLFIGLFPFMVLPLLQSAVGIASRASLAATAGALGGATTILTYSAIAGGAFLAIALLVAIERMLWLRGKPIGRTGTWDCGYAAPNAHMQYTAASYAQPLTSFFARIIDLRPAVPVIKDLFPGGANLLVTVGDIFRRHIFDPLFRSVESAAHHMRVLQQGRVQVYVLYVALTLLVLLALKMG